MPPSDVSRGRQILRRFLAISEERLAYLVDLYETGRWQRYFTQAELLDNVRDAKKAVTAWTLLVSTEALPNNRPVDLGWLAGSRPLPPRKPLMLHVDQPQISARAAAAVPSAATPASPPVRVDFRDGMAPIRVTASAAKLVPAAVRAATAAVAAPKPPAWHNALDFAVMRERYPLLRKTG